MRGSVPLRGSKHFQGGGGGGGGQNQHGSNHINLRFSLTTTLPDLLSTFPGSAVSV